MRWVLAAAVIVAAGPLAAQDDAAANALFRQAHARWQEAQSMAADDPARAEALALVRRDLHGVVGRYPDSTVATILAVGGSVGPLSLAAVEAAVVAGPAVDVLCAAAACQLGRVEALIARFGAEEYLLAWRVELLAEAGRLDEAVAVVATLPNPQAWWDAVARGAARAGRDADAAMALARIEPLERREKASHRVAVEMARAGRTGAALVLADSLSEQVRLSAKTDVVFLAIRRGRLDEAEDYLSLLAGTKYELRAREELAVARLILSLSSPETDALAAFVGIEALSSSYIRLSAFDQAIAALVAAGRLDEAREAARRFDRLEQDQGAGALAKALAVSGRLHEAEAVLAGIGDTYYREFARNSSWQAVLLAAGPEAVLAWSAAASPTMELYDQVLRLQETAFFDGDRVTGRLLYAELIRLAAEIPEMDKDTVSKLFSWPFH